MTLPVPEWARDAVAHLPVSLNLHLAAKSLGVSKATIVRAEARGEVHLLRTRGRGGRRLVLRDELARLLAAWGSAPMRGA